MRQLIEDDLDGLAKSRFHADLDGLEDQIWAKVQARKQGAGASSIGVRATLTLAALAIGCLLYTSHPYRGHQTSTPI